MTAPHGGPEMRGHDWKKLPGGPGFDATYLCKVCKFETPDPELHTTCHAPTPTGGEVETERVKDADRMRAILEDARQVVKPIVERELAGEGFPRPPRTAPSVAGDAARIVDVGKLAGDEDPIISYINSRAGDAETEDGLTIEDLEWAETSCLAEAALTDLDAFPPGSGDNRRRFWHARRKRFKAARLRSTPEAEESE